ncbi:hypothetical protein M8O29_00195 [Enterobacter ludwigii]|nr:hypothetical protein [Enterobacter ludwigii]MCM7267159.1 hypothetical protein [Enterobacter ludwigii]
MRAEGKDYIVKDGDVMNSCLTFDFLTGFKRNDFGSRKF